MDKTGFLKELKQYLAILNEEEQKDIMDEYVQHIDMKMERGMSEAEAIRDFGDIKELASRILEAYHVNPQYQTKKRMKLAAREETPAAEITETGRQLWSKVKSFCKGICTGTAQGLAKGWSLLCKPFRLVRGRWRMARVRRMVKNQDAAVSVQSTEHGEGVRRKNMAVGISRMALRGIRKGFRGVFWLAAWCIRWMWNLCLLFIALLTGGFMLFSLFGLGMLVVLLIQGYPLWGFTVGCLGLVLCMGALTVIACCLCRIKSEKEVMEVVEVTEEMEVQEVPEYV